MADKDNKGDLQAQRDSILAQHFTEEQMKGARWNLPGWTEINQKLDEAGLSAEPWVPKAPSNE